ncbi:MAG: PAS domain-containing sensor histidine kinase, partial [Phycisphaerales bacterium]|nr:PAS domain-containing sensor histidine kinase [Phycisphaerales bacterium]
FGVYIVDSEFRLVRVSAGAASTFRDVDRVLGRDFAEVLRALWTEPFATEAIGLFRRTLATGEAYHAPSTRETRADDGQVESYDWKIERITLPDGRFGVVCHFYDLSERSAFEEALKQHRAELELELQRRGDEIKRMLTQSAMLDRMAAVGTLAAGLGHDLGNLLLPISVSAETLRRTSTGPEQTEAAESILRSMEYVRSLVRGLRLFTLGSESGRLAGPPRTEPEDWARQTSPFLSHAAASGGSGARLEVLVEPGTPALAIDPAALSQAVLNLVQNAADALHELPAADGAAAGRARGIRVTVAGVAGTSRVRVAVVDTGPGMSPEILARCTEPYYTTKTRGVRTGTGLGLALVHETARRCGGTFTISSIEGQGTTVTLEIPAAPEGGADAGRPVAAVELRDPAWRKLGSSLLTASGFSVYEVDGAGIPPESTIVVTDRPRARAGELSRLRDGGPGRAVIVGADGEVDGAGD